jgi:hypothetical protein
MVQVINGFEDYSKQILQQFELYTQYWQRFSEELHGLQNGRPQLRQYLYFKQG